MSPCADPAASAIDRFPRVSGDEPGLDAALVEGFLFSPRERG